MYRGDDGWGRSFVSGVLGLCARWVVWEHGAALLRLGRLLRRFFWAGLPRRHCFLQEVQRWRLCFVMWVQLVQFGHLRLLGMMGRPVPFLALTRRRELLCTFWAVLALLWSREALGLFRKRVFPLVWGNDL